ncbi:unnamed protein product [Phytophthora lilii]|uniref:Unnamed protein product n=1 Tax=Phytophthora lilii TaxID=2077276 RepID=A0A9W6YJK4_9STRA|nr:unnamed protein product [Phytophthora lilii]
MDFTRVSGMDATAARGAFLILKKYCVNRGITLVFANVRSNIRILLLKNDVAARENFFSSVDSAFAFYESGILAQNVLNSIHHRPNNYPKSVSVLLRHLIGDSDDSHLVNAVALFFQKREIPAGYDFYRVSESPSCFYFLASGQVAVSVNEDGSMTPNRSVAQVKLIGQGSMFGEVAFFSRQRQHTTATAVVPCTVFEMTRDNFDLMEKQNPMASIRLRDAIVQSMAQSITNLTLARSSLSTE